MFDVGFWELAIIAVIALLVIGPARLPKAARTAGLWVGRARRMVADVKADIDREVRQSELAELKKAGEEIKSASSSFKSASQELIETSELNELRKTSQDVVESVGDELKATKNEVESVGDELKATKNEVESSHQSFVQSTVEKTKVEPTDVDDSKLSTKKNNELDL